MERFRELEFIDRYQAGQLRGQEVLELFSHLIKTGRAWGLGFGKYAGALITRGYLTPGGDIIKGAL